MSDTFVRPNVPIPLFGFDQSNSEVAGFDVGYWAQITAPPPTEDDLLTNLFQVAVSKMTGIAGKLVRPMWQRQPPAQPGPEVDWCAIGIMSRQGTEYLYMTPDTDYTLQAQRHEYLFMMAMFYGPNADANAGSLRDSLGIPNNWWYLNEYGIRYHEVGETILVSYNANDQFIGRCDLPFVVIRQINRQYPIPTLIQSSGVIVTETSSAVWTTPLPT